MKAVAAGMESTCVLMTTGGVRCWGANQVGQLGDGTTNPRWNLPLRDVLEGVQAIAMGRASICALMNNSGVRCWGDNHYGQLGDGTTAARSSPPTTDILSGVRAISLGLDTACALTLAGGVRCWGNNAAGELGDGTTDNRQIPPTRMCSLASTRSAAAVGLCCRRAYLRAHDRWWRALLGYQQFRRIRRRKQKLPLDAAYQ